MMKKLILCLSFLTCLMLFTSNVFAECTSTQCYGKIDRLYVNGGTLFISTDGDESNLDCTAPGGVYITISEDNPSFKNLYAMMLTSMSLNNNIGLRVRTGTSDCSLIYTYMDNNVD